jgi:prevent-host-death family protein
MSPNVRQLWRDAVRDSDEPRLDALTIAVVFALDRFMSADGHTHTGGRRLARLARLNRETVRKRLELLVELGWLRCAWPGRGHAATYEVAYPVGQTADGEVAYPAAQSGPPGRPNPGRTRAAPRGRPPRGGGVPATGTKTSTSNGKYPDGCGEAGCDGSWHTLTDPVELCPQRRATAWAVHLPYTVRYDPCMPDEATVPSDRLRAHLAEHLDRVLAGEQFVVTRNGRPSARLVPLTLEETPDDE